MDSSSEYTRDTPIQVLLEHEVSALCSQDSGYFNVRFLVATNRLDGSNYVFSVDINQSDERFTLRQIAHPFGPVSHISSSQRNPDCFVTTYHNVDGDEITSKAILWEFQDEGARMLSKPAYSSDNRIICTEWEPNDSKDLLVVGNSTLILWDVANDCEKNSIASEQHLTVGRWDSLSSGKIVGFAHEGNASLIDMHNKKKICQLKKAHDPVVRNLDFNPTRIHEIATCGDDGLAKVWDSRNPTVPIKAIGTQGHWIWSVRYNPSYEHLIITGGSDSSVRLYSLSEKQQFQGMCGDGIGGKRSLNGNTGKLLKIFDDHEDSVYAVEWSQQNNWYFGSISFDGKMMIYHIADEEQVNVLLMSGSSNDNSSDEDKI